jgi:hypothetical protein
MIFFALSRVVERSSTTNSSPPKRNTRSWARNEEVSRLAIRISTSSPYRWPKRSLTCLKWSTSTTASHCFSSVAVMAALRLAHQGRRILLGAGGQHLGQLVVEGLAVEQAGQRIAFAVVQQVLEIAVDADDAADDMDGVAGVRRRVDDFKAGVRLVAEPDRQPQRMLAASLAMSALDSWRPGIVPAPGSASIGSPGCAGRVVSTMRAARRRG